MPNYCDAKKLEEKWFNWLIASATPSLEFYRKLGLLWTQVTTKNEFGYPCPSHPYRKHCLALSVPIFFDSNDDKIGEIYYFENDEKRLISLDELNLELTLTSDARFHNLENQFVQKDVIIPQLIKESYIKEIPAIDSWHAMLHDINETCKGIAKKYIVRDQSVDHSNEAFLQVLIKLKRGKLVYTPGRASVFNLITTTIHRCIISILIKNNSYNNGINKLLLKAQANGLPNHRSLRIHTNL